MAMTNTDITTWPSRSIAARQLGVSSELVTNWLNQGRLRFVATKLGRLIDPADLARLAKERAAKEKAR